MNSAEILIIAGTFLLAGAVKGVVGMGLPTVALALLTMTVGLKDAIILMLVPSLLTNIWQAVSGGHVTKLISRLSGMLIAIIFGVILGSYIFQFSRISYLSALLGALISLYAAFGFFSPQRMLSTQTERFASPLVGLINGLLTGLTGSFVVPSVPYLQTLDMKRDEFIQSMGIVFTISTLMLLINFSGYRLISFELGLASTLAVLPAVIGMIIGQNIRNRLSDTVFRRVFLWSLLIVGLFITYRSLN
ncbi:MAG: sulfite exporter TauE/SafE family protein [Desulfobulbia bacterium]